LIKLKVKFLEKIAVGSEGSQFEILSNHKIINADLPQNIKLIKTEHLK
jgi:hypothetical protein